MRRIALPNKDKACGGSMYRYLDHSMLLHHCNPDRVIQDQGFTYA